MKPITTILSVLAFAAAVSAQCQTNMVWDRKWYFPYGSFNDPVFVSGLRTDVTNLNPNAADTSEFINFSTGGRPYPGFGSTDFILGIFTTNFIPPVSGEYTFIALIDDEYFMKIDGVEIGSFAIGPLNATTVNYLQRTTPVMLEAGRKYLLQIGAYDYNGNYRFISRYIPPGTPNPIVFNNLPLTGGVTPRTNCPTCAVSTVLTSSLQSCGGTLQLSLTGSTTSATMVTVSSNCYSLSPSTFNFVQAGFTTPFVMNATALPGAPNGCFLYYTLSGNCSLDNFGNMLPSSMGNFSISAPSSSCFGPPTLISANQTASETCNRTVAFSGTGLTSGLWCDFNFGSNSMAMITSPTSGWCEIPRAVVSGPLSTSLTLTNGTFRTNTIQFISTPSCCDMLCEEGTCSNGGPMGFTCACNANGEGPLCKRCRIPVTVTVRTSSRAGAGTMGNITAIFIGSLARSGPHALNVAPMAEGSTLTIDIILNACIGILYAVQYDNSMPEDRWRMLTMDVTGNVTGHLGHEEVVVNRRILENQFPVTFITKDTDQAAATEKVYISCTDAFGRQGATASPLVLPRKSTFNFFLRYFNIGPIVKMTLWTPSLDDWIFDEIIINRRGVLYYYNNPSNLRIVRSTSFTDFFHYKEERISSAASLNDTVSN